MKVRERRVLTGGLLPVVIGLAQQVFAQESSNDARAQVTSTERTFAKTMTDRALGAFATFVADDAIFFSGPEPRRGTPQIVEWWARFFAAGTPAPFSWEPDRVEVLASGTLALSTGPVRDPQGRVIGRFNSIWRREPDGSWKIVFDKGEEQRPQGGGSRP